MAKKEKLTKRQIESKKINRKRAIRQWWQVTSRRCSIILVLLAIISGGFGGFWSVKSGKVEQFLAFLSSNILSQTGKAGFRVEDIYLEGRKFTSLDDVGKAVNVKIGDPILGISLEQMRLRLQAIPRIKSAEVARVLPNQIHVKIFERQPIALWQNDGKLRLIDSDGIAMEYVSPSGYKDLLLVIGEDAPEHAGDLLKILAFDPQMYKNIASASRIGERRWNIAFKNGIELKLPEKEPEQAWQHFVKMDKENSLLQKAIKSVDMRLGDRIFIKTIPSEVKPESKKIQRDT
ncbi:MAG: cell division protein FtsQ/DivIB [Pseudomonadota bacterium]